VSARPESRLPADIAVFVCAGLFIPLSDRLVVGPRWILPALVVLLFVPLTIRRHRRPDDAKWIRRLAISLVILLIHRVFYGSHVDGTGLLYSAASIWATNVIVFGLWFWELDRGGPHLRAGPDRSMPDLQFPQMTVPSHGPDDWHPRFFDYLYTSLANGTSFAPADAMPLTLYMKALFAGEAMISFVTIAIVAGEAINILR
jgi:hypothetical protein